MLFENGRLELLDAQSGLGTLADQTGGFLIANSNDLRSDAAWVNPGCASIRSI